MTTETQSQSRDSFEVTCSIGTIFYDQYGTHQADEAAFALIANHNAEGRYSFPSDGRTIYVTVEWESDPVRPASKKV